MLGRRRYGLVQMLSMLDRARESVSLGLFSGPPPSDESCERDFCSDTVLVVDFHETRIKCKLNGDPGVQQSHVEVVDAPNRRFQHTDLQRRGLTAQALKLECHEVSCGQSMTVVKRKLCLDGSDETR
jgi:hypothetical protein